MTTLKFTTSLAVIALLLTASQVRAADHLDAPELQQPNMGDRDINDIYAFQSPTNSANTVLILTVNPFAGMVNPFGTMSGTTFGADVTYDIQIDNTGDAVADVTYRTNFSAPVAGSQVLTTTRNAVAYATGNTETDIATTAGGTIRAGLFDDPFFFDLVGFNDGFNFTGDDTFAGANVSAIVLEVPSSELGTNIGVWGRTEVGGTQVDRMGRPAINTALIPSGMKDAFNAGVPADDFANFGGVVQATIESLNGGDAGTAAAQTMVLLPDVLTFDTSSAAGFLNGRRLADDVIDAELQLLTGNPAASDGVDANDVPFLNVFPYLASPNVVIPEPASVALLLLAAAGGALLVRRRS